MLALGPLVGIDGREHLFGLRRDLPVGACELGGVGNGSRVGGTLACELRIDPRRAGRLHLSLHRGFRCKLRQVLAFRVHHRLANLFEQLTSERGRKEEREEEDEREAACACVCRTRSRSRSRSRARVSGCLCMKRRRASALPDPLTRAHSVARVQGQSTAEFARFAIRPIGVPHSFQVSQNMHR